VKEGTNEGVQKGIISFTLSLLHSFTLTIRRVAGMPDYSSYAEHLRRCHPEAPLPTEREFYEAFIRARYEDGPTRCC
jgi:uncharacterized short protein YbdD (DUF466 family)